MLDFLKVSSRSAKKDEYEVYPTFMIRKSKDLMIRGGDFYAIWDEEKGLWSTDEQDAIDMIDSEIRKEYESLKAKLPECKVIPKYLWNASTGSIDSWHKYCQKQMYDNYHMLDETLIFSNTDIKKEDYASKQLPYPLEDGDRSAYEKLMSTIYSPEERHKIEWAIGSIVTGDSKHLQKFLVLYGSAGTGKSTILNIIQQLFEGYYSVFDAKALGSANNSFALEAFKTNPLVAIQHDGDLSKIEDNTRLNSLVSHELMTVNEKFKSTYSNRFKSFLFMGTNKPVRITDAKSGLLRRLIDVTPSGKKLNASEYKQVMGRIPFELGSIAYHCQQVYLDDPEAYDDYIPIAMMGASNDFYNFVVDSYKIFKRDDGTSLKVAWEMYKNYCDDAKVAYPYSQRVFKEELKNYFWDMQGQKYMGFRTDKIEQEFVIEKKAPEPKAESWLKFEDMESIFDKEYGNCPAQYATTDGHEKPMISWDKVTTTVQDLDTSKLHYVRVPENHIIIDFDIPDEHGNKCLEKNLEAASKWPPTYAELSKSGQGIHLHYIYSGDVSKLSRVFDDHIEIKVSVGKSSLRRKLTKCVGLAIATISSGLPLKGDDKVINFDGFKNEKALRTTIKRNLNKEYHSSTKCSIDFIYKNLNDAYNSGMSYDVSDLENAITAFAAGSTNNSDYCLKLVNRMRFKSDQPSDAAASQENKLVFYDIEVFPNLFLVCWKIEGEGNPVVRMINPSPEDIENLAKFPLVGFNCRRYDNHLMYARMIGYDNKALYELSQSIINDKDRNHFFGEAYNVSYTDIYDFASAGNKKSLKKLEIEMGIHHQELGLPWDKPVPEELWEKVADYCVNDVIATEAAFHYLSADWTARQILATMAGMTVNDTTNSLTTRIIFKNNKKPQSQFHYRNLAEPVLEMDEETYAFLSEACPEMMSQTHGEAGSLLPYFPGYEFKNGKSTYRDINESNPDPKRRVLGEGGCVYAEQGMYGYVALLDIASMHPHSTIAECLFGPEFTRRFKEIVDGRVNIKHEAWDIVNTMLDGVLSPFIEKVLAGEMTSDELADALKTAINSVYGMTSSKYDFAAKDPRNIDNIVAKRGALFMVDLRHEVQKRGFIVAHIKTDSIKIPDATPEIIQFVMDFGKRYGYTFEHEATYDRMCLVNDSTYIAKYLSPEKCEELYGYVPKKNKKNPNKWTATGEQFQIPYVFKTLFSKEDIKFEDMCETFSVSSALYLDLNENLPDESEFKKQLDKAKDQYKKGFLSDTTFENTCQEILVQIEKCHDYRFVGRVGQFSPMKPGNGAGVLLRQGSDKNGNVKYDSANGAKGYLWMESEMVKELRKESGVDRSYYDELVTNAVKDISVYGDFEWFVSDDPYIRPEYEIGEYMARPIYKDEIPWNPEHTPLPFA